VRVLDLERNVSPLVFQETHEFWNAVWLVIGLWPDEKIRVRLAGDGENYTQVLSADSSGNCEIPISTFEPYLLSRKSARLAIQRHGFICEYDVAVLVGSPRDSDKEKREDQEQSTNELSKRPAQRRRIVDRVDLGRLWKTQVFRATMEP
jgi:hypothetical protein